MNSKNDGTSSQVYEEFSEIMEDLQHLEQKGEPLFSALFIDNKPFWRKQRYALILESLDLKPALDPQQAYLTHLLQLRSAPKKHREEIVALFTRIEFHSFCKAIVHLMRRAGKAAPSSDLIQTLKNTRTAIENAPHGIRLPFFSILFQFIKGQVNFHYDPYLQENTPYKLFEYHSIPVIRMGTPTFEGFCAPITEVAAVTPEFLGFLEAYQSSGKKHLYINLQNRNPSWIGRNEAPRCRVLEALSKEYPETIQVITLAKNTSFYSQEGLYKDLSDAALFKSAFLKELFHHEGGFFFGSLITSDKIFIELLDKVHKEIFNEKETLKREERLAFIELFHLEVEKYCIDHFKPDTLNISCKDGIDRAGGV